MELVLPAKYDELGLMMSYDVQGGNYESRKEHWWGVVVTYNNQQTKDLIKDYASLQRNLGVLGLAPFIKIATVPLNWYYNRLSAEVSNKNNGRGVIIQYNFNLTYKVTTR
ncbi:MAG: hypothetical protein RR565_01015 [Erysipelothrix sp.]